MSIFALIVGADPGYLILHCLSQVFVGVTGSMAADWSGIGRRSTRDRPVAVPVAAVVQRGVRSRPRRTRHRAGLDLPGRRTTGELPASTQVGECT